MRRLVWLANECSPPPTSTMRCDKWRYGNGSLSEELIPCENSTQKWTLQPTHIVSSRRNYSRGGLHFSSDYEVKSTVHFIMTFKIFSSWWIIARVVARTGKNPATSNSSGLHSFGKSLRTRVPAQESWEISSSQEHQGFQSRLPNSKKNPEFGVISRSRSPSTLTCRKIGNP